MTTERALAGPADIPTIVVVDDSTAIRRIIRRTLTEAGYRVVEAENGSVALEVCHAERPDLVLLDVDMPVMDGLTTLQAMRADPDLALVSVLFLTARTGGGDAAAGCPRLGVELSGALTMIRVAEERRRLTERLRPVVAVMSSSHLRRLELAWGAFFLVDGTSMVALSVWAFSDGATSAVGVLGAARLLPGALALPFGAWAADRFVRRRVVMLVFVALAVTQAAVAVALATDAPRTVVFLLVAAGSVAATPYRPAQLALVPLVARSSEELVAMNVTAGTLEGLALFVGPLGAALVLLHADPQVVIALSAAVALGGLIALAGLNLDANEVTARRVADKPSRALLGGVLELRANGDLAVLVGCFVAQILVRGMLVVLVVAVSFDLIDTGGSGVGWLSAAMGVGGILGAGYAVSLTGRRHLGKPFAIALVLWGAPLAVIGVLPSTGVAVGALLTVGVGNAILDVSGFTLIQRLCADRTLGRVFGVLFTVGIAMGAIGSLIAPAIISSIGLRPALVLTGVILPALALSVSPKLRSIDRRSRPPDETLALLAQVPLLSALPPTTLEKLAERAALVQVATAETVISEHAPADDFYVIASGQVEVFVRGRSRGLRGPGVQLGEIALLRDSPRTATVVANRPTQLLTINGHDFVDALSRSDAALSLAWRTTDETLGGDAS
jgi:CheY-like chemotaxis protein/MFS family permease